MKVCVINSLYPPYSRGGAEIVAQRDVIKHQEAGDDVFVVTLGPWKGFKSFCHHLEKQDGIRIYRFYSLNIFSFIDINSKSFIARAVWHLIDLFNIHTYICLRKILKQERPELVLTHNLKGIGYTAWWAIQSLHLKNTHTVHDVQLAEPSGAIRKGKERKHRLYSTICSSLIGSPTKIISPSRWLMDFYTDRGFFSESKKEINLAFGQLPLVQKLDLKPQTNKVKFIYASQVETSRGIFTLIKALNSLSNKNWQLEIMNTGSALKRIKKLVGEDDRFVFTSDWQKEKIGESDFLILPSLVYENSPTIIPISLTLRTPVIASNIGGIGEMMDDGVNGYLFEPGSSESLVKVLQKVI